MGRTLSEAEFAEVNQIVDECHPGELFRWVVSDQPAEWFPGQFRPESDEVELALTANKRHVLNAYHALRAAGYQVRLERWGKREIVVLDDIEDADGMTLPDWFYWAA